MNNAASILHVEAPLCGIDRLYLAVACEHGPVSWDEAFADGYGEWLAHITADVAFYVELARRADGLLVELAIGNGRVAIPVAQATGLGRPAPHLRARRRLAPARRAVRLERLCLRPPGRRASRRRSPGGAVTAHDPVFGGRQPDDIIRGDGTTSSLWWATKNEWLGLLDVAGLELEGLYGGFAGEPFADDSREYVFVARR